MLAVAINTVQIYAHHEDSNDLATSLSMTVKTLGGLPGCLLYSVGHSHTNVGLWIITGYWESRLAMEEHFKQPAMNYFMKLLTAYEVHRIDFNSFVTPST